MFKRIQVLPILVLLAVFFLPQSGLSQTRGELAALGNLSRLHVYFDVKADSAAKLAKRMEWINDTYEQITEQGLKAHFIIGFRSHASFFVTRGEDYIDETEIPTKAKIEQWLKEFRKKGIVMEQCGLSAELFDIDEEDFLDEIRVVKNSYVSIAGYQNRGFAYVPM